MSVYKYCLGQEEDLAGYFPGNEVQLKKYKTQKLKKIQEEWMGKKASVTIERYYFASHEDAIALPSISMGVSVVWYGWSKTKDIGDKTSWLGSDYVMFVKGTVLVKVCTGSRMMNKEERKDYTRKVAEAVEKKL